MTLRDDLLGLAGSLRAIPEGLGTRLFTVTVRVEQWDGPLEDEATRLGVATPDLVLSPAPKVRRLNADEASWYGAATLVADGGGPVALAVYEVGPLTPAYADGGYTPAQLVPAPADPSQRLVYLLTGPGLAAAGEACALVDFAVRPSRGGGPGSFSYFLVVRRAPQLD